MHFPENTQFKSIIELGVDIGDWIISSENRIYLLHEKTSKEMKNFWTAYAFTSSDYASVEDIYLYLDIGNRFQFDSSRKVSLNPNIREYLKLEATTTHMIKFEICI